MGPAPVVVRPEPVGIRNFANAELRECGKGCGSVGADGVNADADVVVADLPSEGDPAPAVGGGEGTDQDRAVALGLTAAAEDVLGAGAVDDSALEVGHV